MATWRDNAKKVVPYVPGEQTTKKDVIKINTNENPYPPSPKVKEVVEGYDCAALRLYPNSNIEPLVNELASYYKVNSNQVFVGIGSDDVLGMAFLAFFGSKKPILFPNITYSFYDVWAKLFAIPYKQPSLKDDFTIRKEDYMQPNGGIVLANPNAPTSVYMALCDIEEIVRANEESLVIVDEAYIDFSGEKATALPLIDKYDNVLVVRTFSKSRSMAGSRIGFAIGHPDLIQILNDVKQSYNSYTMDPITMVSGIASLQDEEYFTKCIQQINATRERMKVELKKRGFSFPDSKTNFIFAKHTAIQAKELFAKLKQRGIFVRYFDKPILNEYLRITIGTDLQMDKVLEAMDEILEEVRDE